MSSRPRYTSRAMQDLAEIGEYIARDNPRAASQLVDRLEQECWETAVRPERGTHHEELPKLFWVYRVEAYLIIYQMDGEQVLIVRVVHGARNLPKLLRRPTDL